MRRVLFPVTMEIGQLAQVFSALSITMIKSQFLEVVNGTTRPQIVECLC